MHPTWKLCPVVKVRVQTSPGFAKGLLDGFPKFVQQEGFAGCAILSLFLFRIESLGYTKVPWSLPSAICPCSGHGDDELPYVTWYEGFLEKNPQHELKFWSCAL